MKHWACVATLLLAGCASTVETVDHRMLLQPGTAQYEMDELELFVMPMELDAPLPGFPEGLAAAEIEPVVACVEVWLSKDGDITRVAPVHDLPDCGDDASATPFEASVLDGMRQWTFTPARVCRFREDQRALRERGDCRGDVVVERVPVRLAYAFRFERREGRATVGSRRLAD